MSYGASGAFVVEVLEHVHADHQIERSFRGPFGDITMLVAVSFAGMFADINRHDSYFGVLRAVPVAPVTWPSSDLEHRANGYVPPREQLVYGSREMDDFGCGTDRA